MKVSLTAGSVFLVVTIGAIIGMCLGGAFGYAAGVIAPDMFTHVIPWEQFDPVGTATVVGAFGGVVCGGALGTFAVVMQFFASLLAKREKSGS